MNPLPLLGIVANWSKDDTLPWRCPPRKVVLIQLTNGATSLHEAKRLVEMNALVSA